MKDQKPPSDIVQLYEEFKEVGLHEAKLRDLEKINTEQYKIIQKLTQELQIRETKLKQLEKLLVQTNPVVINVSPEEEICELQIDRLRTAAQSRDLTLEEAKRLDIFIRNKHTSKEKNIIDAEAKRLEIPDAQLLQIAGTPKHDDGNQS